MTETTGPTTDRARPASPRRLVPALLALALVGVACGSVASYAARVDRRVISSDDLETELRSIAANTTYLQGIQQRQGLQVEGAGQGTFDSTFSALVLTRQIYYRLIEAELVRRKLSVGRGDLDQARKKVVEPLQGEEAFSKFPKPYQTQLIHREAEVDVLSRSLGEPGPPDKAAAAYYATHQAGFVRACARHILVATQEKADEVKRRLDNREDFAKVAAAESKDPGSAGDGGLVGCDLGPNSQLVPEFLAAVLSQPVGEVGPPVKTQFGFHLIKVDSRVVPPYDQVKAEVAAALASSAEQKFQELLRTMVDRARIEVNPRYGSFDRTGGSAAVKPPAAPQQPPDLGPGAQPGSEPQPGDGPAPDAGPGE